MKIGFVMKEAPDVDFYVGWSSVVEAPVWMGDREFALEGLRRDSDPYLRDDAPHRPERRLERADKTGTSALWVHGAGMLDRPEEGAWDDNDYIYQQQGILTREGVFVLARRMLDRDLETPDASDLLSPFYDAQAPPE